MENYSIEQFHEDVRAEADALKEHATADELARLDSSELDPSAFEGCIYGQMTGDCTSLRASELIFACCKRYVHNKGIVGSFERVSEYVNGETIEGVDSAIALKNARDKNACLEYLSSIESYIMLEDANNENLIAYLKGETDTLGL